jgi:hypothetical protein
METIMKGRFARFSSILTAVAAAAVLAAPLAHGAATDPRVLTFLDDNTPSMTFSLQVEQQGPDAGAFAFVAPGRGIYRGVTGTAMRVLSPTSIVVQYDGPATLQQSPNILDTSADPGPATAISVHLQAQVDAAHHTAEATLTDTSGGFHLVDRNSSNNTEPTLKTFEAAVVAADWRTIFGMMNSDVTANYTLASFVADASTQSASAGRILALRRVSVGPAQTGDDGVTSFQADYDVDVQAAGQTTQHYTAVFVQQGGDWKIWFTDLRPA